MTPAILLLLLSAPEPKPAPAPAFHAAAWGVVSGDGKTVYLRHDKGIDALDAATGKPAWTAEGKLRPLALAAGLVIASGPGKGSALRLVALDARTGKAKWEKDVAMPDWVAIEGPSLGRSFSIRAAGEGKSLVVGYQANAWYAGGARPTEEIEKAARKEDKGVIKLDVATGKFEKLAADKMPAVAAHRNGDVTFTLEQGRAVVLKRTKGGKALADVTLSDKPARVAVALDGKAVLVQSDGDGKRAPGRAFDTATGESVGRFETASGRETLDAAGGKVFAFGAEAGRDMPFGKFPRTLEVIELKTGKAIWSRKGESLTVLPPPP